ncbi:MULTISPECIES: heme exporter protein CcmD [unclassified Leclercia]|uniref:Heme exporter protein D n=1 Tax=Leclercia barmai TaxID=2785629 RepID=A0ABS7RZ14_9ENTR|nr:MULTISPECIES: heme exporter protein CcmD [unclassified Leclercia]MBZ0059545.1 heme exporter protein CcmD [Leclercia sp. EMC7]MCM5697321.1 heme exporter protein CcmD [Leclercia sp. LTM01]MCM5702081.1 heme exporter protein CcmD [Leclercia sp. LTM14]
MTPAFTHWNEFFAMGGYGLYIWLAVALAWLPLAVLILHTRWQQRAILLTIRRRHARGQRMRNAPGREATL